MRLALVAFLTLAGCEATFREIFKTDAQRAQDAAELQRQQVEREKWQGQRHAREQAAAQEQERQAQAQRDEQHMLDLACLTPRDQYWVNWCIQREREKDRAAQQVQWDRENELRRRQIDSQEAQADAARREARRDRVLRSLDHTSCTTTMIGTTAFTNCY
jgi:hypothetical protein